MSALVIAEAGVNHNGNMDLARELIEVAAEAGADLVKFQTFSARRLTTDKAEKTAYQIRNTGKSESQREMLRRLELSEEMHTTLIAQCACFGIGFFSTGFDIPSIDLLVKLGIDRLKIPSGEITNLPYLRHAGAQAKEIILSTGMATFAEVESAVDVLQKAGTPREHITVLHCTSDYPTQMSDVNLRAMLTMRDALGVAVGYSDHTSGIEVAIAAVALGATVIEKHFTLDRSLVGPDHKASLEPNELKSMVAAIRNIEVALGDGVKRVMPGEAQNKPNVRKSLVAATEIRAGDAYNANNLAVKRPATGLSPMLWDSVIGRKAPRDFLPDEPIEL